MKSGFAVIWRKIQDTSFYKDADALQLAIHLILKANHQAKRIVFNGKPLLIERGQCVTGRDVLANELGANSSLIYRKLKILEKVRFLDIKSNNKYSIVTVLKYDTYQSIKVRGEQQIEQPMNSERTTSEQQNDTNNNTTIKPLNKIFKPPTLEEVTTYCQERKNAINSQSFLDYYESIGWMRGQNKIRDWKACIRTWESRDKTPQKDISNDPRKRML